MTKAHAQAQLVHLADEIFVATTDNNSCNFIRLQFEFDEFTIQVGDEANGGVLATRVPYHWFKAKLHEMAQQWVDENETLSDRSDVSGSRDR